MPSAFSAIHDNNGSLAAFRISSARILLSFLLVRDRMGSVSASSEICKNSERLNVEGV